MDEAKISYICIPKNGPKDSYGERCQSEGPLRGVAERASLVRRTPMEKVCVPQGTTGMNEMDVYVLCLYIKKRKRRKILLRQYGKYRKSIGQT